MNNPDAPAPLRKSGSLPDHVRNARARKRAEAEALGIDDAFIAALVETFYGRIRADARLGPIFTAHVADWDAHLARLKQFWRSVLHSSGEFTGNPMRAHMALPRLETADFAHWLDLFYSTLAELGAPPAAVTEIGTRARMIAESLLTGIATRAEGLAGARAGADLPWPPTA
jgi:hemoglobin